MRLKDYCWAILKALSCRLAHNNIACLIGLALNIMSLCELNKPSYNFALLLRWTWHLADVIKLLPNKFWL
jgi:hypothetical protein